jgi:hypothetical protein
VVCESTDLLTSAIVTLEDTTAGVLPRPQRCPSSIRLPISTTPAHPLRSALAKDTSSPFPSRKKYIDRVPSNIIDLQFLGTYVRFIKDEVAEILTELSITCLFGTWTHQRRSCKRRQKASGALG